MDEQRQDNQQEPTYNISLQIQDVALKTYQERWMIEKGGGTGSGRSVLATQYDDNDDDIVYYIVIILMIILLDYIVDYSAWLYCLLYSLIILFNYIAWLYCWLYCLMILFDYIVLRCFVVIFYSFI